MSVLTRYLTRLLLIRFILLLFGMSAFLLGLDLTVNADNVMGKLDDDHLLALGRYTLLRLPIVISDLIKIAALLAGLLTLTFLIKNSELTAIWNSGVSQFSLIRRMLPLAALLGIAQFVIDDQFVPGNVAKLQEWGIVDGLGERAQKSERDMIWIHVGSDIIRIPAANIDAHRLHDFILFERNEQGRLLAQIDVTEARYSGSAWRLFDLTVRRTDGAPVESEAVRDWPIELDIASIKHLLVHPRNLPFSQVRRFISGDGQGTWAPYLYETWFYEKLTNCLVPFLMLLLSVVLAQQSQRAGHIEFLLLGGIILGFSFFIFSGVTLAMGEVGLLPPLLASSAPLLVFATIAASVAFWHELKHRPT